METTHNNSLYLELSALENSGITIWLDGSLSDSDHVTNKICVNEDHSYMRDYIFEEGVLKEIHFDKISK